MAKLRSDVDKAKLGRAVEEILLKEYVELLTSTPRQIWLSFVRGLFAGLGGVIGATVMVTILLFALQKIGGRLPVMGPYLKSLGQTIQTSSDKVH